MNFAECKFLISATNNVFTDKPQSFRALFDHFTCSTNDSCVVASIKVVIDIFYFSFVLFSYISIYLLIDFTLFILVKKSV